MTLDCSVLAFASYRFCCGRLTFWVSHLFVWLSVFIGLNLIQSAFTGFCPAANVFRRFGVKPAALLTPIESACAPASRRGLFASWPAKAGTLTLAPTLVPSGRRSTAGRRA